MKDQVGMQWESLKLGTRLDEYEIVRGIGKGGMGEVYEARNINIDKRYALKILHKDLVKKDGAVIRFKTEGRVMADMAHPHIVHVNHMGSDRDTYYIVMDYIAGPDGAPKTLSDKLRELEKHTPLSEHETKRFVTQMCDALDYAHTFAQGEVIHRDLKPSNILIDAEGNYKISDFGLARLVDPQRHEKLLREHRSIGDEDTLQKNDSSGDGVVGSFDYMSPEQRDARPVDHRTDIFSLGIIIYRLLTGHRPAGRFALPSEMALGVSPGWDRIIEKSMCPEVSGRYGSVQELMLDLDKLKHPRGFVTRGTRQIGLGNWLLFSIALTLYFPIAFGLMYLEQAGEHIAYSKAAGLAALRLLLVAGVYGVSLSAYLKSIQFQLIEKQWRRTARLLFGWTLVLTLFVITELVVYVGYFVEGRGYGSPLSLLSGFNLWGVFAGSMLLTSLWIAIQSVRNAYGLPMRDLEARVEELENESVLSADIGRMEHMLQRANTLERLSPPFQQKAVCRLKERILSLMQRIKLGEKESSCE